MHFQHELLYRHDYAPHPTAAKKESARNISPPFPFLSLPPPQYVSFEKPVEPYSFIPIFLKSRNFTSKLCIFPISFLSFPVPIPFHPLQKNPPPKAPVISPHQPSPERENPPWLIEVYGSRRLNQWKQACLQTVF